MMDLIKNTAFELTVGNNVFDTTKNIAGSFVGADGAESLCPSGFLCVRTELLENRGFSGRKNGNAWRMQAAPAGAVAGSIYALNLHDVNEITDPATGAAYRLGANTLGLPLPAGVLGCFTRIDFGVDVVAFGEGNFKTVPTTEKYAVVDGGLLKPVAARPASGCYFEIVDTGSFTVGVRSGGKRYVCAALVAAQTTPVPAAPVITSPASFPHQAQGDTVALSGTCDSGDGVKVSVFDGESLLGTVDASGGTWSYTLDTSETGKTWNLSVSQTAGRVVSARSAAVQVTRE